MSETLQQFVHASGETSASTFDDIYQRVSRQLEAADFAGADPFDGLNSRIFSKLPLSSVPIARLAWQQLFKRSPIDFRPITLVPPSTNPVTLALAARTYALNGDMIKMSAAFERLKSLRSDPGRWGHGAWGYPFPWQAKAFYVPLGVPNVIATAYAVRTVAECSPSSDDSDRIITDAAAFVEIELMRRSADGEPFIGYVPTSDAMVHNANLWGAYVLALAANRGDDTRRSLADAAIDYTLRAQRSDGSWPYGESSHHRWTDGFHTGYVIEALQLCRQLLKREDLIQPIARGTEYYVRSFLRDDGVVPYYDDGRGPLDVNNFAQLVITLERVRLTPDWTTSADRVLAAAIKVLWCPQTNAFAYQRRGSHLNRITYPRWTQIWMMYALGLRLAHHTTSVGRLSPMQSRQ
jgi:polysaccharide biosynthesis protein VpsJ